MISMSRIIARSASPRLKRNVNTSPPPFETHVVSNQTAHGKREGWKLTNPSPQAQARRTTLKKFP